MTVTVTANPAVDQTLWVPGFRAGEVNRVAREQVSPGGKGVNVAAFLAATGTAVHATGFLGTPNAGVFEAFFERAGIGHGFRAVPGTTRTGIKIVDGDATTDVNFPGFEVTPADVDALVDAVAAEAAPGRWVVLAGSLPPGAPDDLWATLTTVVRDREGRVALDTSGPAFAAGLAVTPDLVKPNREELEQLLGRALGDLDAVVVAARELAPPFVIVSMGGDGAVFVRGDEAFLAVPPPVDVASTVGAGDAMVAGAVTGVLRELPLAEIARLATAFSAVKIARVGLELDPAAVRETAEQVEVRTIGGSR